MARNLTDTVDGFLRTARQLIHDRDPVWCEKAAEARSVLVESPK